MPGQLSLLPNWPRAGGNPAASARIRVRVEDFEVEEVLGFAPDGEGEHCLLQLEKRGLNTADVVRRLSRLAGVPERDIGYCGLKDRHAVTSQWFSLGMAGRPEPDWRQLDEHGVSLLQQHRHRRKLRRGVHRGNRFRLRLRELSGDRDALQSQLERVRCAGVPNYFGEQRFGRGGGNLQGALDWLIGSAGAPRRQRRSLFLSAARSFLFNLLLAERVRGSAWEAPLPGDVCMLDGSGSFFTCDGSESDLPARSAAGDLHAGLPLWGAGRRVALPAIRSREDECLEAWAELCRALEDQGVKFAYRPARLLPDDFSWQFCDDEQLLLSFGLQSGGFATAVLRELVLYADNNGEGEPTSGE